MVTVMLVLSMIVRLKVVQVDPSFEVAINGREDATSSGADILVGAVGSRDAEIGGEVVVTSRGRSRANALGTVCPSKMHGGAR